MNSNGKQPRKVLIYGDVAVPTGFGRIGAAIYKHLASKGYNVYAACIQYDGLLPPRTGVPFAAALQGKPFEGALTGVWAAFQPDLILSLQDFPYHINLRHGSGVDWSTTGHVALTPVDGVPIYKNWLDEVPNFDALMTISEFGVEAFRKAGHQATLCPPGVDASEFYPLPDDVRATLREKVGLPADAFVVGMMAMNQGRKDFPSMVAGFAEAFRDVPEARLYLDCDKMSPAGWDMQSQLMDFVMLDHGRVLFREDALKAGVVGLNERYNLLDLHAVIAHREGFGLPHIEAMATGIPSVAIDYCSGPEIIGIDKRGALIKATPGMPGTWGGAVNYRVDVPDLAKQLRYLYDHPAERKARGAAALAWVKTERTWERAMQNVDAVLDRVFEKRGADMARKHAQAPQAVPVQPPLPAGVTPVASVINLNAPIYVGANNPAELAEQLGQAVGQQAQQAIASVPVKAGDDGKVGGDE